MCYDIYGNCENSNKILKRPIKMQSEGEPKMRGTVRPPLLSLCHGCLSSDRELSSIIGEFVTMYKRICNIKMPVAGRLSEVYLCWECTAILKRVQSFHKQVNNAWNTLSYYIYKKEKSLPKSLSSLITTNTNHDCICLTEPETQPDIKPLAKIKQEVKQEQEDDFENTDINNDLTYLEDIKCQDPALINKLKTVKKNKNAHKRKKLKLPYGYVTTPDKMIVTEQARQIVFKDLWERDIRIAEGSDTKCEKCTKGFNKNENSETHNRKYHDVCIGPHVCDICSIRYPTQDELANHVTSHSVIYRCKACGHLSLNKQDAVCHTSGHEKVVMCRLCEFYCEKVKHYFPHHRSLHSHYECDHCEKRCKSKQVLERHITRKHIRPKCVSCARTFQNGRTLQRHVAVVHAVDRGEACLCVQCGVQFRNRARLERHLRTGAAHEHERPGPIKKERVKCLACDKHYSRRSHMMEHYRHVHAAESRHYCSDCDKHFLTITRYKEHRSYNHDGVEKKRDHLCGVCGRGFTTKRVLTHHIRTHTGERPYACTACDARFAQRTARDTHLRRHNRHRNTETE